MCKKKNKVTNLGAYYNLSYLFAYVKLRTKILIWDNCDEI